MCLSTTGSYIVSAAPENNIMTQGDKINGPIYSAIGTYIMSIVLSSLAQLDRDSYTTLTGTLRNISMCFMLYVMRYAYK